MAGGFQPYSRRRYRPMTAALKAMKRGKATGGGVSRADVIRSSRTKRKSRHKAVRKKRRLRGYSSV